MFLAASVNNPFQSAPRLVAAENGYILALTNGEYLFQSAPRLVAAENRLALTLGIIRANLHFFAKPDFCPLPTDP